MFYNIKIAFRNLRRNGLYSWINVIGLAISITAALFILLWVDDERLFDKFHTRADDIYMLVEHSIGNDEEDFSRHLPAPLARAVEAEIPEVEAATAVGYEWQIGYLEYEKTKIFTNYPDIIMVDTTFFNLFEMEFVEGDVQNALKDPYALILTEEFAEELFGGATALGKTVKTNTDVEYHVTGVVRSFPSNTALEFRSIISFEQSSRKERWTQWSNLTYLLLHPDADPKIVGEKIAKVHESRTQTYKADYPYILQPITEMRLYGPDGSETGIRNIRLFTIIAFSLLIIACINYVNLVTARARKRAKEIGLRKIVGAGRGRLFAQMMGETMLLLFVALILATILLYLLTPYYNILTDKNLIFNILNKNVLLLYLTVFLLIIFVAGIYPAVFLSSFGYREILHSAVAERKSGFPFRKILIVLQFVCSVVLIFATVVINRQYHFMQTKNPGYDRENIFAIDVMTVPNAQKIYSVFKQELAQQPSIAGVTATWQHIMETGNYTNFSWDGMPQDGNYYIAVICVDRDVFSVLNLKIVEGEGFSGTPADSAVFFLNQEAIRMMNVSDPLNTTATAPGWGVGGKITGVVEDFHFKHMSEPMGPAIIFLYEYYGNIYVKAEAGQTRQAIAAAKTLWESVETEYPFNYTFMDDTFDHIYKEDVRTRNLFNIFAVIAIFISCLGLFGLVTYTAETRTKEIGIRKVLGASVWDITTSLTKEFLILIGIAFLIALPLAYFWMDKMLQDYAYRIDISWLYFALAAGITLLLTILTVSFQALKAATSNPVKAVMNN